MPDRELLIDETARLAGTSAGGLAGALFTALFLAPAFLLVALGVALFRHGTARAFRWRPVCAALLFTVLLTLAVEMASEEIAHWFTRLTAAGSLLGLALAVLFLPIAWWVGRSRPDARFLAANRRPSPPIPRVGLYLALAAILLLSTAAAALLKRNLFSVALLRSALDVAGLGLVAAPLAWLFARVALRRGRGTGVLTWATTLALSAWLSLAWLPIQRDQTVLAMKELSLILGEINTEQSVRLRKDDRWTYGECAPLVRGMSRFYQGIQRALQALDDLDPVLREDSFTSARALQATEARLVNLRQRLADFDGELEAEAAALRRDLQRASISLEMREQIVRGVDSGLEGGLAQKVSAQLAPLLEAVSALIEFMKTRQGRYSYRGAAVVFERDADAAGYDRLVAAVEREQGRAQARVEASRKRLQQSTAAFREWAEDPFHRPRPARSAPLGSAVGP